MTTRVRHWLDRATTTINATTTLRLQLHELTAKAYRFLVCTKLTLHWSHPYTLLSAGRSAVPLPGYQIELFSILIELIDRHIIFLFDPLSLSSCLVFAFAVFSNGTCALRLKNQTAALACFDFTLFGLFPPEQLGTKVRFSSFYTCKHIQISACIENSSPDFVFYAKFEHIL